MTSGHGAESDDERARESERIRQAVDDALESAHQLDQHLAKMNGQQVPEFSREILDPPAGATEDEAGGWVRHFLDSAAESLEKYGQFADEPNANLTKQRTKLLDVVGDLQEAGKWARALDATQTSPYGD